MKWAWDSNSAIRWAYKKLLGRRTFWDWRGG